MTLTKVRACSGCWTDVSMKASILGSFAVWNALAHCLTRAMSLKLQVSVLVKRVNMSCLLQTAPTISHRKRSAINVWAIQRSETRVNSVSVCILKSWMKRASKFWPYSQKVWFCKKADFSCESTHRILKLFCLRCLWTHSICRDYKLSSKIKAAIFFAYLFVDSNLWNCESLGREELGLLTQCSEAILLLVGSL